MTKFERAVLPFKVTVETLKKQFASAADLKDITDEVWQEQADRLNADVIWKNDTYQVNITPSGNFLHLSIKRIDKLPIREWRDLQRIKNELVGPEYEAVELYPAESRLVDSANQYHLWVVNDPTFKWPFGFRERMVIDGDGQVRLDGTRQAPFKKENT